MNNSDQLCSACQNSRRYWSSLHCLRDFDNPTRNDIAGAPDCSLERRMGRFAAAYYDTCGFHGRYFEGRTGGGRRLLYLAVNDGACGYAFGTPSARSDAVAKLSRLGCYRPATAEIIDERKEWLCTGRLVYLALHSDGRRVTGYVYGTPAERNAALARYAVEAIYSAATAVIVEDVP
ncbi:MAG: hypothetical protein AB7P99_21300 [Vicinamibacterales bacterium]